MLYEIECSTSIEPGEGGRWEESWMLWEAAEQGHLHVLKWMAEIVSTQAWDVWTFAYAAKGGNMAVCAFLREVGCPWDELACSSAAFGGNLRMLQWLRQHGCPWDATTCSAAARGEPGGHLHILKWAHQNGCPWDRETCRAAWRCKSGPGDVLHWAIANGCPHDAYHAAWSRGFGVTVARAEREHAEQEQRAREEAARRRERSMMRRPG